jgi:catechol 2,3-dioxygenase-like lactoylglutathione lyase family enzyme
MRRFRLHHHGSASVARWHNQLSPKVARLKSIHVFPIVRARYAFDGSNRHRRTGKISMNDVAPMRQLSPATQPISPAKFAHFVLRTGQFETMAKWYQTVLAARVVFRDERLCFLSYDDEHHRLALIHIPGLPERDPDAVGTDHVAYAYNNLGELLSTYRRLKAAGIVPHWPINHGVTTSMYYRDPDNNRVELQIDNFATPAELDGYFHGRAFAENPVGVTYDPEELCRRYETGEAMADLLRIPPLPEGKTPWDMLSSH